MNVIPDIENRLYGGRALVGFSDHGEYVASWPELTHESLRALNHLTGHGPIPAQTVYRVLGELKGIGYLLPQACAQLARGLEESLDVLDVYEPEQGAGGVGHRGCCPAQPSPDRATELGYLLEAAQAAIAEQGYRTDDAHPSLFEDEGPAMNDPITTQRPRPATSGLLLKAAVVIPDVIISSLLWLVIIAALPPAVGFALTVVGVVISALLAAGLGEDTSVRFLFRARRADLAEAPRLAVAWRIATHHLDADGIRLRIVTLGSPVDTAGRRHLLLSREVVDAYCANEITAHAVAALIAEGIGRLRHGHTRFDLLWTFWTIPWDFIRGIANAIGRRLAWIPLVQFAWRTRFILGTIAVVLEAQVGRWPSPIIIGAFIGLSYLMPRWRRSWFRYLDVAATSTVTKSPFKQLAQGSRPSDGIGAVDVVKVDAGDDDDPAFGQGQEHDAVVGYEVQQARVHGQQAAGIAHADRVEAWWS